MTVKEGLLPAVIDPQDPRHFTVLLDDPWPDTIDGLTIIGGLPGTHHLVALPGRIDIWVHDLEQWRNYIRPLLAVAIRNAYNRSRQRRLPALLLLEDTAA